MRAALVREIGGLPEPAETDPPERDSGRALVRIHAVSLNPIDVALAAGKHYLGPPKTPYVPGSEGVGTVVEAGSSARGTRVYISDDGLGGRGRDGTLAELATVAEEEALPLPDGVSDELAVACGTAGLAGWLPVAWRAEVVPGDRVLVLGCTGTVGLIAIQAAKLKGAQRVVAAGRRPERLETALEVGADAAVRLDDPDLVAAFRDAFDGHGPSVVIDPLWGRPLETAAEACAPGARIVQIGQLAGPTATLASNIVRGKQLEILGYSNFVVPKELRRAAYAELVDHAAVGDLRLPLETYPFERVADAWKRQAEGPGAKLVVRVLEEA
ncbi:MAG TPA: zinc-binding alcohol dehydrogenase family protein [Gaiellaceae bacterium]|nr:zinc-binding alcohol dehydrogenase family protein [Gaiellaceae bacterium]